MPLEDCQARYDCTYVSGEMSSRIIEGPLSDLGRNYLAFLCSIFVLRTTVSHISSSRSHVAFDRCQ